MKKKRNYGRKNKKIILKYLFVITMLIAVTSSLFYRDINAAAMSEPSFNINITKDKTVASVNDEVTITGTIIPNDFTKNITKKRIVFVLDTSGSMKDYSRLVKAKAATKEFLNELKNSDNIEVGMVSFAKYATIATTNNKMFYDPSNPSDYNALVKKIDALNAVEGTNTAEGMRKARYLLDIESDYELDKSLILMTDGVPTYYPAEKINTGSYWKPKYEEVLYKTVNNNNPPIISQTGISITPQDPYRYLDGCEKSRKAAVEMGSALYPGDVNVYTIGYSLDDIWVNGKNYPKETMKEMHEAMHGKSSNLYYAGTNTIEELFKSIANELKSEYKTEEVEIKIDLTDAIESDGYYEFFDKNDKPLDRGIIVYKANQSGGKVTYSAEPIKFVMKVTGKEKGNFTIKGSVKIDCPELKYSETILFSFGLTFDDRVPDITAELISTKEMNVIPHGQFTVSYKINAEEFKLDYVSESEKSDKLTFDTYFNFDLNSNFTASESSIIKLTQTGDSAKSEKIPVTYVYNKTDKTYYPEDNNIVVNFKFNSISMEETLEFGAKNFISYVGVYGQSMENAIYTPTIFTSQATEIIHGFFDGKIEDGMPVIDEDTENKVLTSGTNRKMAASLLAYDGTKATLRLSPEMKLADNTGIKVYRINDAGTLQEINFSVSNVTNTEYLISFANLTNSAEYVLIEYVVEVPKEKLNDGEIKKYEIDMQYLGKNKAAIITTKGLESSPELF